MRLQIRAMRLSAPTALGNAFQGSQGSISGPRSGGSLLPHRTARPKMPFKTRRSSTRGTPRALFGSSFGGLNHVVAAKPRSDRSSDAVMTGLFLRDG